jgi:hypothetical protein
MLGLMIKDSAIHIDLEDQIIKDSLITHAGDIVNAAVRDRLQNAGA